MSDDNIIDINTKRITIRNILDMLNKNMGSITEITVLYRIEDSADPKGQPDGIHIAYTGIGPPELAMNGALLTDEALNYTLRRNGG